MALPRTRGVSRSTLLTAGFVALLLLPSVALAHTEGGSHPLRFGAPHLVRSDRESTVPVTFDRTKGLPVSPPSSPARSFERPGSGMVPALPPHPSIVDPDQYYTREPAPMGVADFGVTAASPGATAYAYSSSSFQGRAVVRSLSVTISGSSSKVTAFELNAVVVLERNGTNFSYWIQNGLHLDASSNEFTIGGAYVWNFSSPGATLSPGELMGNAGSVLVGDTYYFIPGCGPSYAGQCTTLGLPATLTGRIVTSASAAVPYVAYQYDLGAGWVTYDNVSFPHMVGASDAGFHVDGYVPTPRAAGLYYDAEWVWVGAGGGSASTDQGSDINLTLSSWNGHNYQAVPTAWNFGSNTGETSTNVTDVATTPLGGHLTSGPGTLGVLYNLTDVGFLNASVPTRGPATVLVDGRATAFDGGWVNLTLPAGTHSLYLENYTNASRGFAILAGSTTLVDLSGAGEVAFNESGLPSGTSWGVRVNGLSVSTSGSTLNVNLPNGSYPVTYLAVPGYSLVGSNPSTVILPGTTLVPLLYTPFTYEVTAAESGLPPSTPWWINASGTEVQGTGSSLQVAAPNGSTPFTAGSLYEFVASPDAGTITVVAGTASPVAVSFSYRPTFVDGTVVPADANVSIGGVAQALAAGTFNDSVHPGTYELVASASGYATVRLNLTATPGNVTWENLTLVANSAPTGGTPPPASAASGISVVDAVVVLAAVAAVVVAVLALAWRQRRR